MARYEIGNLFDIPLEDNKLLLSFREMRLFLSNSNLFKQYIQYENKYLYFLSELTLWGTKVKLPKSSSDDLSYADYYYTCLNMNIRNDGNSYITFSTYGLLLSMANLLSCLDADKIANIEDLPELITKQIKELRKVKTIDELSTKFPYIYLVFFLQNKNFITENIDSIGEIVLQYRGEKLKNDFISFNTFQAKMNRKYNLNAKQLEALNIRTYCNDRAEFSQFIIQVTKHFTSILSQFSKIEDWLKNNPVNIRFNESDIEKIIIYILDSEMDNIYKYAKNGKMHEAQECVIIVEQLIKKYQEMFPNSNTRITISKYVGEGITFANFNDAPIYDVDFKSIYALFSAMFEEFPFLHRNINFDNINGMNHQEAKDYIHTYIKNLLNNINDNLAHGAVEMTESELEERVRKLKAEIADEKLLEQERNLKKLILAKIQMVLEEIKPIAIQTGIGLFKGYYIYFYANGMVAIDRINGYGALYTMPYHVYQLAKDKKGLTEVRYMSEFGVSWHHHKNSSWLENARKCILEGTNNLTEEDVRAAQEVISIKFPYTLEELKQLEEWLKENDPKKYQLAKSEIDRRKERAEEFDDIDSELAENITEDSSNDEGFDNEINTEIEELISSGIDSFKELYEYWKKHYDKTKTKRNPVVAAITKNRARDEEGRYRCELCGCVGAKSGAFDSHHMIPLAKGGVDNIYNTICLCPNCHRDFHMGYLTDSQKYVLFMKIKEHIKEDCPEYENKFLKMISPVVEDDESKASNPLTEELFNIDWSSDDPKKGFKKGI